MSRHLLIAGTGRAGTSFLVRYLTQLGLDTHLSRFGSSAAWDERANAGLENVPLGREEDLPYVIKSPFTYQVIHDMLARKTYEFDAVVIPMRDLVEAAASRSIVEMQAMHRSAPWMTDLDHTWEHYGHTWGGIVYSTSPIDQARLLAVGFHQLLEQLVKADIKLILLSFPRLVEDADYLHRKLATVLPEAISADQGRLAHAATADPSKVRVGREVRTAAPDQGSGFTLSGPDRHCLERAALNRILTETRQKMAHLDAECANARAQLSQVLAETAQTALDLRTQLAGAHAALQLSQAGHDQVTQARQELQVALADMTDQRDRERSLRLTVDQALNATTIERDNCRTALQILEHDVTGLTAQRDHARRELVAASSAIEKLRERLASMEGATTWRAAQLFQRGVGVLPWSRPLARRLFRTDRC